MKKTTQCLLILLSLIFSILLVSCNQIQNDSEKTTSTTQNTTINSNECYFPTTEVGIWSRSMTKENTYENGSKMMYCYGSMEFFQPWWDTKEMMLVSMRSATYTATDFPEEAELCEYMCLNFIKRRTETHDHVVDDYIVEYVYDYKSEKLFCTYNGSWYEVTDYEGLLCDLTTMSGSFDHEKFAMTEGMVGDDCFFGFSYKRFFARKTGKDNSLYSGFVYTEPLEELTEEKIIERAQVEAGRIDTSLNYMWSTSDPYTGYWFVEFYGDLYFTSVYFDEQGRTVQISTSVNVEH